VKALVFLDCTWNFQKLTALESFGLSMAGPIFKVYPYKLLVDQSLAITATSKASQDILRPAVESLSKEEFIQIMMEVANCLHYEPGYKINKPLLLMVGEKDSTGNIRKAMPLWAAQEPDCRFVVIPGAKHAANLDNPDFFHKTLVDFLLERCR
jgi:3-oxoadipate enol-lactonase